MPTGHPNTNMTDSGSFIKVPSDEEEENAAKESQRKRQEAKKMREMEEAMNQAGQESQRHREDFEFLPSYPITLLKRCLSTKIFLRLITPRHCSIHASFPPPPLDPLPLALSVSLGSSHPLIFFPLSLDIIFRLFLRLPSSTSLPPALPLQSPQSRRHAHAHLILFSHTAKVV